MQTFSNRFAKQIHSEYGFGLYGAGGSWPVKVEYITLCFFTNSAADIQKARNITIPIALKFVERMNQDSQLKQYLANDPAEIRNVDLVIAFKQNRESPQDLDSVFVIGSVNKVVYNAYNEEGKLITKHKETFDEALNLYCQDHSLPSIEP